MASIFGRDSQQSSSFSARDRARWRWRLVARLRHRKSDLADALDKAGTWGDVQVFVQKTDLDWCVDQANRSTFSEQERHLWFRVAVDAAISYECSNRPGCRKS